MKPRLFIGSSTENLVIANAVQELLEYDTEPVVWNQGIFGLSRFTLEGLLSEIERADFAIFVFTLDDIAKIRGEEFQIVRDNVIFELGLFTGRLGRERTFIVQPRGSDTLHLPTDLLGLTPAWYDPDRSDGDLLAALGPACNKVRRAITAANATAPDSVEILLTTRNGGDKLLGTPEQRLASANELWVSGNDCKFVVESLSGTIKGFLKRGGKVKVMCTAPRADISEMLSLIDPRFDTPNHFLESIKSVLFELESLSQANPDIFEYRLLPVIPAMGFFITDCGHSQGIVKVEIYTSKPWQPIDTRPHIIVSEQLRSWRQYFVNQWENYWKLAKIPETAATAT